MTLILVFRAFLCYLNFAVIFLEALYIRFKTLPATALS